MIHLMEAIVGVNKRPIKIGDHNKTFGELKVGDSIWEFNSYGSGDIDQCEFKITCLDKITSIARLKTSVEGEGILFKKSELINIRYCRNTNTHVQNLPKDSSLAISGNIIWATSERLLKETLDLL